MAARRYEVGDLVFSRADIYNDGGVPDVEEGALLAAAGTRGLVVRAPGARVGAGAKVYLVRFEGPDQMLGPPVGCLDEELTNDASKGHAGEK
jgi:nitrogen fixation protein NifZ